MTTQRKLIRAKVKEIMTGNTSVGANVFASRTRQLWPAEELPAIMIYTLAEEVSFFDASPQRLKRDLTLAIQIVARADDELDDTLDDIAQQVESIMSENQYLGDLCGDLLLTSVEMHLSPEGDSQHGSCILAYTVTYYTIDAATGDDPRFGNLLVPLDTADVQWKAPPFDRVSAEDTLSLPRT